MIERYIFFLNYCIDSVAGSIFSRVTEALHEISRYMFSGIVMIIKKKYIYKTGLIADYKNE